METQHRININHLQFTYEEGIIRQLKAKGDVEKVSALENLEQSLRLWIPPLQVME